MGHTRKLPCIPLKDGMIALLFRPKEIYRIDMDDSFFLSLSEQTC